MLGRSFDITNPPNFTDVKFNINRAAIGLLRITTALSTIEPAPHSTFPSSNSISVASFCGIPRGPDGMAGHDLRLIDEEVTPIGREFMELDRDSVSRLWVGGLCFNLLSPLTDPPV